MHLNYNDANTFSVEVAVEGRDPVTLKSTGKVLGSGTRGRIGLASLGSGRLSVPVLSDATKVTVSIVNDTASPSSFISADWEGHHISRGRHVG
jgi:hypothetical protein